MWARFISTVREPLRPKKIIVPADKSIYALEADAVGEALARNELRKRRRPSCDSLGNMATLDAWRASVGLVYESEKIR